MICDQCLEEWDREHELLMTCPMPIYTHYHETGDTDFFERALVYISWLRHEQEHGPKTGVGLQSGISTSEVEWRDRLFRLQYPERGWHV